MRIGLVSDTHGLLRPSLFEALDGVEHIIHSGDLGPIELIAELEAIAPVTGVTGNTDGFDLRARWPETERVELAGITIGVMHGHQLGSPTPERIAGALPGIDLGVFGHTHRAVVRRVDSVLVVNPGAAGPARFNVRATCAVATVGTDDLDVELISLDG